VDLRDLRLELRRNWLVAVATFVVCVALGAAAAFVPAPRYQASATIKVTTRAAQGENASPASVSLALFLIPGIEREIASRSMRERAVDRVPEAYRQTWTRITATDDASVITVVGRSRNAQAAAAWVNATVAQVIEEQAEDAPLLLSPIDSARPSTRVVDPPQTTLLVGSVVLGLIAALLAALVVARLRRSFDSTHAIRERLGTTVLGQLPDLRVLRRGRQPVVDVLEQGGLLVDAFTSIRTSLEFRLLETRPRAVAVASYSPSTGKSTVTAGLGWILTKLDRDVVLIDADLRRPALHDRLGEQVERGLGDMAAGGDLVPHLQATSVPGLTFVSAGLPTSRPGDAVAVALPRAIDALSQPGRLILVDSPPITAAAEALVAASETGHVILVVDDNAKDFSNLPAAVEAVREAGAVLLGVVINRVPARRLRKVSYSYSYGSRDGAAEVRRPRRPLAPPTVTVR
jgi:Mrp family chromosome partitioning ATPase/capsular polysaccharide biosynthesis protein